MVNFSKIWGYIQFNFYLWTADKVYYWILDPLWSWKYPINNILLDKLFDYYQWGMSKSLQIDDKYNLKYWKEV